ncbi:MAG: SGNH/GDSL hydrolase family protein [Thermodesulfobacteriota bacterium]
MSDGPRIGDHWSYNPKDGTRFAFEDRWPGILQTELGNSYRVMEESVPGRTTNWDSPFLSDRNGRKALPLVLDSHMPVDLFILMLGTNDLWKSFGFTASDIAASCMSIIWTVQKAMAGPGFGVPEILLIAPQPLGALSPFMKLYFEGRAPVSRQLAREYKNSSQLTGCHFLDASKYVKSSRIDGVHLDAPEQRKFAMGVKKSVLSILGKG